MLISLKSIKRAGKKKLFIIPYLFTYLNAIFGFFSILKALEGDYKFSAIYIIFAVFADGIDGRLARALNSASGLGMELDSLCDAISFCLAPIVLLYSWYPGKIGLGGKATLIFYLCAGLFRLAKFNLTTEKQKEKFIGLPTPIGASFIASLILYDSWLISNAFNLVLNKAILFPSICFIALLMISIVPFYSLKKYKFNLPKDYVKLLFMIFCFAYFVNYGYPIIFILTLGYILFSIFLAIIKLLFNNFMLNN